MIGSLKQLRPLHALYRRYALSGFRASLGRRLLRTLKLAGHLRLVTREDLEDRGGAFTAIPYGPAEVVVYDDARTHPPTSRNPEALRAKTLHFSEPRVFEVVDAELVGWTPVGFDAQSRVILETIPAPFAPVDEHLDHHLPLVPLLLQRLPMGPSLELDVAALLTNAWTGNYWHWLIDVLTRLEGLEDYAARNGVEPTLLVPDRLRSWQSDSLTAAGHTPANRVVWRTRRAKVQRLVIPSFRRQYDKGDYHRPVSVVACRWLRNRIVDNLARVEKAPGSFSPRIYISRRDAAFRRVANEDEVIQALERIGFETYTLSDMRFAEQVTLFTGAEVVIAPHGAGLANLIFADTPIVIELFSPYVIPLNANLARGLGFPYGYLCGTYPRGASPGRDGHMVVNVKHMLDLLETMEGRRC
jgi:hypothetical protein